MTSIFILLHLSATFDTVHCRQTSFIVFYFIVLIRYCIFYKLNVCGNATYIGKRWLAFIGNKASLIKVCVLIFFRHNTTACNVCQYSVKECYLYVLGNQNQVLCSSLYCNICFITVVWNWIYNIWGVLYSVIPETLSCFTSRISLSWFYFSLIGYSSQSLFVVLLHFFEDNKGIKANK